MSSMLPGVTRQHVARVVLGANPALENRITESEPTSSTCPQSFAPRDCRNTGLLYAARIQIHVGKRPSSPCFASTLQKLSPFVFWFEALQLQSCKQLQQNTSAAFSPVESTGIYAVHQVKCVHNNLQNKGLIFHSEGEKDKNRALPFFHKQSKSTEFHEM